MAGAHHGQIVGTCLQMRIGIRDLDSGLAALRERLRRAGAEIHRDREPVGGVVAFGPSIRRILFPVQAGHLVASQIVELSFAASVADATDSRDRAGA